MRDKLDHEFSLSLFFRAHKLQKWSKTGLDHFCKIVGWKKP